MTDVQTTSLGTTLSTRWAADRAQPAALRLTLPHLVLASTNEPAGRSSSPHALTPLTQLLAAHALQPSLQPSPHPTRPGGRQDDGGRRVGGPWTGRRADEDDGVAITGRYVAHCRALTDVLTAERERPQDLLPAWDEMAGSFDYTGEQTADGLDAAGRPWMPTLGGLHPGLPLDPTYRRLAAEPGGADGQLVLLAVAGEVGYQRLAVTYDVLAAHLAWPCAAVVDAVDRLVASGWLEADAASPRAARSGFSWDAVLRVAPDRVRHLFRRLAAG